MSWCPKCNCEFREGYKKCSVCNEILTKNLHNHNTEIELDMDTFLTETTSDIEADILEGLLRTHDILIMREYKEYHRLLMDYSWSVVRIYVPSKSYEEAKRIIDFDITHIELERNAESEENQNEITPSDDNNLE